QIADRTGCSRKYVKRMLDIFKKTGTVRFECSLNLSKIPIYPIFIGIRSSHPKYDVELMRDLGRLPCVCVVTRVAGSEFTHILRGRFPTMQSTATFGREILRKFHDKIETIETMHAYRIFLEDELEYLTDSYLFSEEHEKMDIIDWKILKVLNGNGLASLKDLKKEVKLTEPSIYRRIKELKRRGILNGFFITRVWQNMNPRLLPTRAFCMLRTKANSDERDPDTIEIDLVKKFNKIRYAYGVFGRFSVIAHIKADSLRGIDKITSEVSHDNRIAEMKTFVMMDSCRNNWIDGMVDYYKKLEKSENTN
ncbi:MAG: Lrp/AsnC family transcriptional regulator, partial [Candidatus Aenigmatarchaeota archaeon]